MKFKAKLMVLDIGCLMKAIRPLEWNGRGGWRAFSCHHTGLHRVFRKDALWFCCVVGMASRSQGSCVTQRNIEDGGGGRWEDQRQFSLIMLAGAFKGLKKLEGRCEDMGNAIAFHFSSTAGFFRFLYYGNIPPPQMVLLVLEETIIWFSEWQSIWAILRNFQKAYLSFSASEGKGVFCGRSGNEARKLVGWGI